MVTNELPLAVIPARGGSKRVPRKNIREFGGRPMIAWAIEAALEAGCFGRVIVSTDDEEVAKIAMQHGAEVPFLRPPELADDYATTSAVISHATRWARSERLRPTSVCCIYATAAMISPRDILEGFRLIETGRWRFVFAATKFETPVQRGFELLENGGLQMLWPESFACRSQDLPVVFHDAAQFYWGLPEAWNSLERIFDRMSTCVEIPGWRGVDIDTEEDWIRAELLFRAARAMKGSREQIETCGQLHDTKTRSDTFGAMQTGPQRRHLDSK